MVRPRRRELLALFGVGEPRSGEVRPLVSVTHPCLRPSAPRSFMGTYTCSNTFNGR